MILRFFVALANRFSHTFWEFPALLYMSIWTHGKYIKFDDISLNKRNKNPTFHILGVVQSPEDLKQYIVMGERGPSCGFCHTFSHHSKTNVLRHIESKHFPNAFLYQCTSCGVAKQTKTALERHMSKCISRLWLLPRLINFVQGRFPDQRILTNISFRVKLLAATIARSVSSLRIWPSLMWETTWRANTSPTVLSTIVNNVATAWAPRRRCRGTRLDARVGSLGNHRIFCIDFYRIKAMF